MIGYLILAALFIPYSIYFGWRAVKVSALATSFCAFMHIAAIKLTEATFYAI